MQAQEQERKQGKSKLVVWQCSVLSCQEVMVFRNEEPDVIGFLVVHHLVSKHGWTRSRVLAFDASLAGPAKEYIGVPRDRHGCIM